MCRIEEKTYVDADGRQHTFEDSYPCHKARPGKLCSSVTRKTIRYPSKPPLVTRADNSSPSLYDPPTPTSSGTYMVTERKPASSGRPSTRDGARVIKPEITIEFGKRKDSKKVYSGGSSRSYKRSSLGATSISSNDIAVESPGSDASNTVRTGFPEASIAQTGPPAYTTRHAIPQGHHRQTSSGSSYTTSSQPPSLYATSDPDSPSTRRPARYPPTIVHNPPGVPSHIPPSSPTAARVSPAPSSPYRTTIAVPRNSGENIGVDGIFPNDYSDLLSHSGSSHANSGKTPAAAPEITDRDAERARQRQARIENDRRQRQMEADREMAEAIQKDEEAKQVRFEVGRAEYRAKERAENSWAQNEKRRAEEREDARRQKNEKEMERAKRDAAKEARRKAERVKEDIERKEREVKKAERAANVPTRTSSKRHSRRLSMSHEQIAERDRALAETHAQMARERAATEQRERDEQAAMLVEQQKTTGYYSTRGPPPTAYTIVNEGPGVGRRNSTSRRGSVSSSGPPIAFGQNRQRRVSIVQDAPPVVQPTNPPFPQPYGSRPSSSHGGSGVFSTVSVQPGYVRAPSARHSSYDKPNPFAQPPPASGNPFSQSGARPPSRDFWAQDSHEKAPTHTRQNSDDRQHTLHRRGKEVIERSDGKVRKHDRARQATVKMGKAVGFENDYIDTEDENEEDRLAGYGPDLGLNKGRKKKH